MRLNVTDTCHILILQQCMPPPPKALITEKEVLGCMRRTHFLMPPLAVFNHLVRGAQTMACMAFKGHYNIALSSFTATTFNGPCLKERIKLQDWGHVIWTESTVGFVNMGVVWDDIQYTERKLL